MRSLINVIFVPAEVVIGFERVMYTTNEGSGEVIITILLIEGELSRTVELDLSTMDGTALSKCMSLALLMCNNLIGKCISILYTWPVMLLFL